MASNCTLPGKRLLDGASDLVSKKVHKPSDTRDPTQSFEIKKSFDRIALPVWVSERLKSFVDSSVPFDTLMAEFGAAIYLVAAKLEGEAEGTRSFVTRLELKVKGDLSRLKGEHKLQGEERKKIPTGRTSLILHTFIHLIIPDGSGVFKPGLYVVRALLGPTAITSYLKEEHRALILSVVDSLMKDPTLLDGEIAVADSLHHLCRIDQKCHIDSSISQPLVKQWILQMLFSDILQWDGEKNCYAVAALKFCIHNNLPKLLEHIKQCLSTGVYRIGGVEINIETLMREKLVRAEECSLAFSLLSEDLYIVKHVVHLSSKDSEVNTFGKFFQESEFTQQLYCSYHRNVLQRLVLEYFHLIGVNGTSACPADVIYRKEAFVIALLGYVEKDIFEKTEYVIFRRVLGEVFWLWDCNVDSIDTAGQEFRIGESSFSGLEGIDEVNQLLHRGRTLLHVYGGETTRVLKLSDLLDLLKKCAQRCSQKGEGFRKESYTKVKERLELPDAEKEVATALMSQIKVEGFMVDFLTSRNLLYFSQTGGRVDTVLKSLDIPFKKREVLASSAKHLLFDLHQAVRFASPSLALGACVVFHAGKQHVTTFSRGELYNQKQSVEEAKFFFEKRKISKNMVMNILKDKYSQPLARKKIAAIEQVKIESFGDYLNFEHLNIARQKREAIRKSIIEGLPLLTQEISFEELCLEQVYLELNVHLPITVFLDVANKLRGKKHFPREWARWLRKLLIQQKIGVFPLSQVEQAVRRVHSLPPVHSVADTNWCTPSNEHIHWKQRLHAGFDGVTAELYKVWKGEEAVVEGYLFAGSYVLFPV